MKVVILAAGPSTRFGGKKSKLLQVVNKGKTVIEQTISNLEDAGFESPYTLVIGHQGEEMKRLLGNSYEYVYQRHLKGTGTALQVYLTSHRVKEKEIVVILGDLPRIQPRTFLDFYQRMKKSNSAMGAMTADVKGRSEFRIIKGLGDVGVYFFKTKWLKKNIFLIKPETSGEVHINALAPLAEKEGGLVLYELTNVAEALGVNTSEDLQLARRFYDEYSGGSPDSSTRGDSPLSE